VRLPITAPTSRPGRIHSLTQSFLLEDRWALTTPGGGEDFATLLPGAATIDPAEISSRALRALFALRLQLGNTTAANDLGEEVVA
jgi:hypothetical protein